MRSKSATEALISQRASHFVKKFGPESESMADSILQAMRFCGSETDLALWTGIVNAVQQQARKTEGASA